MHLRVEEANLEQFGFLAARHQADAVVAADLAIDDLDVGDHALVGVVVRVEDQGARACGDVAGRGRHMLDHRLQDLRDADARLGRGRDDLVVQQADEVLDFFGDLLRISAREVDLVDDGDDRQVVLQRQVDVRHRLRFDPLRRIDDEERALAGRQAAADLVGEVDVAGGVDQVQFVGFAITRRIAHAHGARLDRDALLALEIHRVEDLRHHLAAGDGAGLFQQAVGERRFAVIDVGDDAEVANP